MSSPPRSVRAPLVGALIVFGALANLSAAQAQNKPAPAPSSASERQARADAAAKSFLVGRYEEALAIYADLYIQSNGRPEYLRNIGRCQQKLRLYDAAIETFRDYLRRMKPISAAEKREVEGFIKELETAKLNAEKGGGQAPPEQQPPPATAQPPAAQPPTAGPAPAPEAPPGQAEPPPNPWAAPPQPGYGEAPGYQPAPTYAPAPAWQPPPAQPPAPRRRTGSALKTLGLIVGIAGVAAIAAGVGYWALARSTYDDAKADGCPNGSSDCDTRADSVQSANSASKALYVVGGVATALGVTLLIVAPRPESPTTPAGLAIRGTF
jgi:tetratricopeptide (TPR) repeat protein